MTHDPRYPVGPFHASGRPLTAEERRGHIETIAGHPSRMRAAVAGLDDRALDTPYREGGWTVRQVIHHVADSHVNSFIRFRLAVTEDHPRICTYDQDAWAALPDAQAPIEPSLLLLEGLHERWVTFLNLLPADAFARTVEHPEIGDVSVDTLLELYGWHCAHHEGHVTALREAQGW